MVNISNSFSTSSEPIADFFQKPGLGFYIPLYQREYSWDDENIDQLMEDICQGVGNLLSNDNEIRFLGTIIKVKENNPAVNIDPRDQRAFPTRIDNVIDGQQRISTIALLASLVYQHLSDVLKKLPVDKPYGEIRDEIRGKLLTLQDIFAVDLRRGTPSLKPIIIRGSIDRWTLEGDVVEHYKSPIASYLALVIRAIVENSTFPNIPRGNLVGSNLKRMREWLRKVEQAHIMQEDETADFPPAWEIIQNIDEKDIWTYARPELRLIVENQDDGSKERMLLCSVVQYLSFVHYLLYRCCFTTIDPVSEHWAFDMFQSLNATGTPLTAIETFKPVVVNIANTQDAGFKGSKAEQDFKRVDQLLVNENSAARKSKLTNEYLTAFAHVHDGTKLAQRFSIQRKWLVDIYNHCTDRTQREEFLTQMGDVASYLESVASFDVTEELSLPKLDGISKEQKELATFCVLYVHDAGHKMAHTILSRFYSNILREDPNAVSEFIGVCKAVAAFYTLWRAAASNSGLDNVYRQILRGNKDEDIEPFSCISDSSHVTSVQLKSYLRKALEKRRMWVKEEWKSKAIQELRFDSARPICKFALFIVAHDTIPDDSQPGLIRVGAEGSTANYLTPSMWRSKDYKTIEHIAPQSQSQVSEWDKKLYQDELYQSIGNLTLLPANVNTSAGNRGWRAKWVYYAHLAETDPILLGELSALASQLGVELASETIELLTSTPYKNHIVPLVNVGKQGEWNADLVLRRTHCICDLLWDRLSSWLE